MTVHFAAEGVALCIYVSGRLAWRAATDEDFRRVLMAVALGRVEVGGVVIPRRLHPALVEAAGQAWRDCASAGR